MASPSGLWAEGDPLSPTNLNRRNPVGTFPAKIYHVAWAAGTGTTQITNAIANANVGGYNAVFVDASRLPYDASAVTFNTAVHMLREGGNLTLDEYDVRAYGAWGDASHDDFAAIEAATLAITAQPSSAGAITMRFPPGTYSISQPLWSRRADGMVFVGSAQGINTEISVSGDDRSFLALNAAGGPTILVSTASATVLGIGPSLVSGTGNSWTDSDGFQWFNFRDITDNHSGTTTSINGLSAFTVECFYQSTFSDGVHSTTLIQSLGQLANDPVSTAFNFYCAIDGKLTATLTTTGGSTSLAGTTNVRDGVVHHVAASWNGATLFLWVDGQLQNSTARNGTLVQKLHEEIISGGSGMAMSENTPTDFGPRGKVSSVRLSNACLYTVNFTPPSTELTLLPSTIVLTNFENPRGPMVKAYMQRGTGWLVQRDAHHTSGQLAGYSFYGMAIGGLTSRTAATSIFFRDPCTHWVVDRCHFTFFSRGIFHPGVANGFDTAVTRCAWAGGATAATGGTTRFGILQNPFCGLGSVSECWIDGVPYGFVNAGNVIYDIFYQAEFDTIAAGITNGTGISQPEISVWGMEFNTEPGVGPDFRGVWIVGPSQGVNFDSCVFETAPSVPFITVQNIGTTLQVGHLTFKNTNFHTSSPQPTSIISVAGTPKTPIVIDNCNQESAWIPWSNTTGTVVIRGLGPAYSASTGSTLRFDASLADEWDLTLTSDVTQSSWQSISYGQPVSGAIKMDSTGSRLFVWPTNSKGTATLSYGSAAVNTFTGFYDGVNVILTSVRTGL